MQYRNSMKLMFWIVVVMLVILIASRSRKGRKAP